MALNSLDHPQWIVRTVLPRIFSSNLYSAQDGLSKMAYFISKARFFCANGIVDSRSNDGSFAIPATGAINTADDQYMDGDYKVATNVYNDLTAAVQANPTLLNWAATNLTGQRDVDFFQPTFDGTTTMALKQLSLSTYIPVIFNQVNSQFSITLISQINAPPSFILVSTDPALNKQSTPSIALTDAVSGLAISVTISSHDIWLFGQGLTAPYNPFFLCPSAWLVTVLYSSGVSSYLAFWNTKTGFYLQGGANLVTSPTQYYPQQVSPVTTQAIVTSNWQLINCTNAYIQASVQQYAPQTPQILYNMNVQPLSQIPMISWSVPIGVR